jgi:hypothetical protein
MEDLPVAFYVFVKRRIRELRSNTAAGRAVHEALQSQTTIQGEAAWMGPCVLTMEAATTEKAASEWPMRQPPRRRMNGRRPSRRMPRTTEEGVK